MQPGQLIRYQQQIWRVLQTDPVRDLTAHIQNVLTGKREQIFVHLDRDCADTCQVLSHPTEDWKLFLVPMRVRLGVIREVRCFDGQSWVTLVPFEQWVMPEENLVGGNLFIAPSVHLLVGGLLNIRHEKGDQNVRITSRAGTPKQRKARAQAGRPKPVDPVTAYDMLEEGDDEA